jgi:hypothetical protein
MVLDAEEMPQRSVATLLQLWTKYLKIPLLQGIQVQAAGNTTQHQPTCFPGQLLLQLPGFFQMALYSFPASVGHRVSVMYVAASHFQMTMQKSK